MRFFPRAKYSHTARLHWFISSEANAGETRALQARDGRERRREDCAAPTTNQSLVMELQESGRLPHALTRSAILSPSYLTTSFSTGSSAQSVRKCFAAPRAPPESSATRYRNTLMMFAKASRRRRRVRGSIAWFSNSQYQPLKLL
jgi:hypothetical protein